MSGITDMTSGDDWSLVLNASTGKAYSCGYNTNGQLSINNGNSNTNTFQVVKGNDGNELTNISKVSGGNYHSIFLVNGEVYTSGYGGNGEQGDGSNSDNTTATKITFPDDVTIVDILGTYYNGFAKTSDDKLYVWGKSGNTTAGTLTSNSNTPVLVTSIDDIKYLYCYPGGNEVLAMKNDYTLWGWGPSWGSTPTQHKNFLNSVTLQFDNYNKLTIENPPANATTTLKFTPSGSTETQSIEIGNVSTVNIAEPGKYSAIVVTNSDYVITNEVTIDTVTIPSSPYRSINQLDTSIAHTGGAFNSTTIAFWARTDSPYQEIYGAGPLILTATTGFTPTFGVLMALKTDRIWAYSGCSTNSSYQFYYKSPPAGFDPTKWNFFIFYTPNSQGGTSKLYMPEFNYSVTSTNSCTRTNNYLNFDLNMSAKNEYLTDISIYNKDLTATERDTLYNNGNIGGAANLSTNRRHYFRFNSNNLRLNEGTSADIGSSVPIGTSTSLPNLVSPPSLSFENDVLILNDLPTDHTETIIEKKDGASFNVGKATEVVLSEPGEYKAIIKSPTEWTFTEYINVEAIGNVTTYLNGLTTHMISPQSGEQYMKSITFKDNAWTSDIQGQWAKYPVKADIPITWTESTEQPYILTDMGIFKNNTTALLANGSDGMLTGFNDTVTPGWSTTKNVTSENHNVLMEMTSSTYVNYINIWDARGDWTLNGYEIWAGMDTANLELIGNTIHIPTTSHHGRNTHYNNTNSSTVNIDKIVKFIEIRKWKLQNPNTSDSSLTTGGLGIGEIYIHGKKATII
jgi:hypothetical protein